MLEPSRIINLLPFETGGTQINDSELLKMWNCSGSHPCAQQDMILVASPSGAILCCCMSFVLVYMMRSLVRWVRRGGKVHQWAPQLSTCCRYVDSVSIYSTLVCLLMASVPYIAEAGRPWGTECMDVTWSWVKSLACAMWLILVACALRHMAGMVLFRVGSHGGDPEKGGVVFGHMHQRNVVLSHSRGVHMTRYESRLLSCFLVAMIYCVPMFVMHVVAFSMPSRSEKPLMQVCLPLWRNPTPDWLVWLFLLPCVTALFLDAFSFPPRRSTILRMADKAGGKAKIWFFGVTSHWLPYFLFLLWLHTAMADIQAYSDNITMLFAIVFLIDTLGDLVMSYVLYGLFRLPRSYPETQKTIANSEDRKGEMKLLLV